MVLGWLLGMAYDPKHTTSPTQHGGGSVIAWTHMAADGTDSLVFITDRSQRISDMYRTILSAQIQLNAAKLIGWGFTVQMDTDPKHTAKASQVLLRVRNGVCLSGQVSHLISAQFSIRQKTKPKDPQTNEVPAKLRKCGNVHECETSGSHSLQRQKNKNLAVHCRCPNTYGPKYMQIAGRWLC